MTSLRHLLKFQSISVTASERNTDWHKILQFQIPFLNFYEIQIDVQRDVIDSTFAC